MATTKVGLFHSDEPHTDADHAKCNDSAVFSGQHKTQNCQFSVSGKANHIAWHRGFQKVTMGTSCCGPPADGLPVTQPEANNEIDTCEDRCCGQDTVAETDDCCGDSPVDEEPDPCANGCCGSTTKQDDGCAGEKGDDVCGDGCCDEAASEIKAEDACKDACCGSKEEAVPDIKEKAIKDCNDGCCDVEPAQVTKTDNNCSDSCCDKPEPAQPSNADNHCSDGCCDSKAQPKKDTEDPTVPDCCRGKPSPCCDESCLERLALRECDSSSTKAGCGAVPTGEYGNYLTVIFEADNFEIGRAHV